MPDYYDPTNLGAYALRRIVTDFLADRIPPYMALVRAEHPEFDENTLPDVVYFDAYDPYTSKAYPLIGMYINGSDDYVMEDTSLTGGQTFTSTYDCTIFVSARTALLGTDDAGVILWESPERDSSIRIRDIYMGALKSVMFNEPSFGTAGLDVGRAKLLRGSYQEIMTDPVESSGRYLSAGLVTASIEFIESTTPPVYGYLHNIDTTVGLINDGND